MADTDFDAIFPVEVFSQMLGRIDRAVLSTRTAKREHQRGEATLDISLHMVIGQPIDTLQERQYLTIVLQEADDRLVQSSHLLIFLVTAGIMRRSAVEHITASVAAFVFRYSFLVGKAENADNEGSLRLPTLP